MESKMNALNSNPMTFAGSVPSRGSRSRSAENYLKIGYLVVLFLCDSLTLFAAMRFAYLIRFELKISVAPDVVPTLQFYEDLAVVIVLGCILLFTLAGLYNWNSLLGGTTEYSRAFNAIAITFLIIILATYMFQSFEVSRVYLTASWLLSTVLVLVTRFALRRVAYALRKRGHFRIRTAIVAGKGAEVLSLIQELKEPRSGYEVVGLIAISEDMIECLLRESSLPSLLGTIDDLGEIAQNFGIAELVVSSSSLLRENLIALYIKVHQIPGLELRLSTGLFELLTTGVQVRTAGIVPLISLKKMRLSYAELMVKTTVDYLLTIAGLLVLMPLFAIIALTVKLDSPGPVFHRRKVLGVGGKEFYAYKFRTMYVDGDRILGRHPEMVARLHLEEKLKKDPRITLIGGWLRRFSIDELPQLFNVLKNQMSLVGPRMISSPEAEKYGRNQFNLLSVKPGLTGLWQVSGRSDLSYQERIRLDMYYVRNYSIWLDFHILFIKTANAVLSGRGAY
jgi:exopolysaccharide biosynthesis polyprenyl glycosylphosphotransferase